MISKWSHC